MPRNISFWVTQQQFRDQTKYVTRRSAWDDLKPGTILMGCEKCQGLGKGGTIVRLGKIRVLDVRREPLFNITKSDVVLEGFPRKTRLEFISLYMAANKKACPHPGADVNRIEYEYLDPLPIFTPGYVWAFKDGLLFYFYEIAGGHVYGSYLKTGGLVRIELANFLFQYSRELIFPIEKTQYNYFSEVQTAVRMYSGRLETTIQ